MSGTVFRKGRGMATYVKAENIEILIDRKNYYKAVLRNTLTKEMREFTDKIDVKIIEYLEPHATFCNENSECGIHLSVEDIGKQLHISNSRVENILIPLFEAGFLVDDSNLSELFD